jgi:uncharacterized membrane protein YeaQ/YmgE (transglycosylase-associated protein family)
MTNVIVWLVIGAVSGWLASLVTKTENPEEILLYVMVGSRVRCWRVGWSRHW